MAQIALNYSAAQINAAIAKVNSLITYISEAIVQLYDGSTAIYPRTKAEAVFFGNDTSKTLDVELTTVKSDIVSIQKDVSEIYQQNVKAYYGKYVNNYNLGTTDNAIDGRNGILFIVEKGKSYKHNIPYNALLWGSVNSFQVFDKDFKNLGHPTATQNYSVYTINADNAEYMLVSVNPNNISDVTSFYLKEIGSMYDKIEGEIKDINNNIESIESVISTKWVDKELVQYSGSNVIGSDGVPTKIGSYTWEVLYMPVTAGKKYRISDLIPAYLQASGDYHVYSILSNLTIVDDYFVINHNDIIEVGPKNNVFYNDYGNSMEIIIPEGGKWLLCSTKQAQQLVLDGDSMKIIMCWGDSLTAASKGWPATLQNLVEANTYKVINRGIGGQDSATIAGRQGGVPFFLVSDVTLPANTNRVKLPIATINNMKSLGIASKTNNYINYTNKLLCQGDYFNNVTINGIECKLTKDGDNYTATAYYLQRVKAASDAEVLKAGSVLYGSNFSEARNTTIGVFFIGQNGGYNSPDTLVSQVKKMIEFSSCGNKFIAITSHGNGYENVREAFNEAFGATKVLNLQWYFPNYGIIDAVRFGLATKEEMAGHTWDDGTLKPSNDVHLTALGYKVLANKVYEMMVLLGYFN